MTWWGLWCPGRWGFTSEGPWEPVWGDGVWAGDWTVEGGLRVSKWPGEEDGLSRPVYRGRVWRTEVRGDLQADLGSQIRNKSSEFRFCDSYNTHTLTRTHTHTCTSTHTHTPHAQVVPMPCESSEKAVSIFSFVQSAVKNSVITGADKILVNNSAFHCFPLCLHR